MLFKKRGKKGGKKEGWRERKGSPVIVLLTSVLPLQTPSFDSVFLLKHILIGFLSAAAHSALIAPRYRHINSI